MCAKPANVPKNLGNQYESEFRILPVWGLYIIASARQVLNSVDPDCRAVLLTGPTAIGKSALAMDIASKRNGIVVNADALQVYSCWRVLTARPSVEDEKQVQHLMYGHVDWRVKYSVGVWLREIERVVDRYSNRLLVIVGGTGLYFSALENGLAPIPSVPDSIRAESKATLESGGLEKLVCDLERNDPETLSGLDRKNPMRVQRAWEVLRATGRGLASWKTEPGQPVIPVVETARIVLYSEPGWLSNRIELRMNKMVRSGALEECMAAMHCWRPELPFAKAHGAAHLISHLKGECSLEEAVAKATIATRQYAKRQRVWFRSKMADWNWIGVN